MFFLLQARHFEQNFKDNLVLAIANFRIFSRRHWHQKESANSYKTRSCSYDLTKIIIRSSLLMNLQWRFEDIRYFVGQNKEPKGYIKHFESNFSLSFIIIISKDQLYVIIGAMQATSSALLKIFFLMTSRLKWIKFKYLKHDVSICSNSSRHDCHSRIRWVVREEPDNNWMCWPLALGRLCHPARPYSWPSVTRAQRPWWRDLHFDFRHLYSIIILLKICSKSHKFACKRFLENEKDLILIMNNASIHNQ